MRSLAAPLRIPAYSRLLAAFAVNGLGTWFGEVALAVVVLQATGSAIAVALVLVAGQLLPGLLAPALTPRLARARGRILPRLFAGEALLFALMALGAGRLPLVALLALIACDGVLGLPARAIVRAQSARVTGEADCLREGNALINIVFSVQCAAGAGLAGLAVALAGPQTALGLDALSFAACALLLAGHCAAADEAAPRGEGTRVGDGLRHVRAHPAVARFLAGETLAAVLLALIIPVEIVFVTRTLGGDAADYGLVLTAWGAGMVAGSAALPVAQSAPLPLLCVGGLLAMAASYLAMGLAGSVAAAAAWSALGGVGNGVECFAITTLVQERTPAQLQVHVASLLEAVNRVAPACGFLLGGLIAGLVSPRASYLAAAGGVALVAIVLARGSRLPAGASAPAAAGAPA